MIVLFNDEVFLSERYDELECAKSLLGVSAKLLSLLKLELHLLRDLSAEAGKEHHHDWKVSKHDEGEDGSLPKGDGKTSDEHRNSVDKLSCFLADTFADSAEVFGNLRGQRLDLLLLEKGGLLLEKSA